MMLASALTELPVHRPAHFSRELSWIDFNRRVLAEATHARQPLLERLKFLAISDSNLDEFLMVRVSGLQDEVEAHVTEPGPDGLTPAEELAAVRIAAGELMAEQRRILQRVLLPKLARKRVRIVAWESLPKARKQHLRRYLLKEVFPHCVALALGRDLPFPFIPGLALNLGIVLQTAAGDRQLAALSLPPQLPRLVPVAHSNKAASRPRFVWLEDLIAQHVAAMFPQATVRGVYAFRVLRDADFEVRKIEAPDLLEKVRQGVLLRRSGQAVALQVDDRMDSRLLKLLMRKLELRKDDVYRQRGPFGLSALHSLLQVDRPDLKYRLWPLASAAEAEAVPDMFARIRSGDVLLHHPFDSFDPVLHLLRQAADDPDVGAIKQTLYRIGPRSPVAETLRQAAQRGKQVSVLLELKARFDEENNLGWAEDLEKAGVDVSYGFTGLKTHAKVLLIERREGNDMRQYAHIGTGNYNATTSREYTDLGLLTYRQEVTADVARLFRFILSGYSLAANYETLLVAPANLRYGLESRIAREAELHSQRGGGHLIFKMNALTDPPLIQALYLASQTGVKVDLLVRGACCLRPGVPGLSDNIRVFSLIGRFLEHGRVYYFANGGNEEVFVGSADLMQRNLTHRVEVLAPVLDARLRDIIRSLLQGYLADNCQTHELLSDGRYERRSPNGRPHDMQDWLLKSSV